MTQRVVRESERKRKRVRERERERKRIRRSSSEIGREEVMEVNE